MTYFLTGGTGETQFLPCDCKTRLSMSLLAVTWQPSLASYTWHLYLSGNKDALNHYHYWNLLPFYHHFLNFSQKNVLNFQKNYAILFFFKYKLFCHVLEILVLENGCFRVQLFCLPWMILEVWISIIDFLNILRNHFFSFARNVDRNTQYEYLYSL